MSWNFVVRCSADKQHEDAVAKHPRYVAAASLRQCDDRNNHDDHPIAPQFNRSLAGLRLHEVASDSSCVKCELKSRFRLKQATRGSDAPLEIIALSSSRKSLPCRLVNP